MKVTHLLMSLLLFAGHGCGNSMKSEGLERQPASAVSQESDRVAADEKDAALPCSGAPCLNGGTCIISGSTYGCKCAPYFSGANCNNEALANVALLSCGASCSVSSTSTRPDNGHVCENAIDGLLKIFPNWGPNSTENIGAWYRVHFSDSYRIQKFSVFIYPGDPHSTSALKLHTNDYKTHDLQLTCLSTGEEAIWQHFVMNPTITDYLHIEVTDVCDLGLVEHVAFCGIMVYGNDVPLVNAASLDSGATCTASSEYHQEDFGCHNAIDGNESPGLGTEWLSDGQGVGAWIQVTFNRARTVMAWGFLQRCNEASQNSGLSLRFSDNSTQPVTLDCYNTGLLDCNTQYWQQFDAAPQVMTTLVRIEITAVCTTENNGFREIRIFTLTGEEYY